MTEHRSLWAKLALVFAYASIALFVTAAWTWCARTEIDAEELLVIAPSGEPYCARFNSIVRLVDGRAMAPFVKRRLLPDATRLLVHCTPQALWSALERRIHGDGRAAALLRGQLQRLHWQPRHYPILFTATALIWVSVLGFMGTCRALVRLLYHASPGVADVLGGSFGLALLGGNGDWHYLGYPYDFPNVFVFTLALTALLARRWWFFPIFLAAVYSKETSVLLILAYCLLAHDRRMLRFWAMLGLLAASYVAIRGWIEVQYPSLEGDFFSLRRNAKYLAIRFFYMWWMPPLAVAAARLIALRRQYPAALRRLCWLVVPLLGMAIFKGWIEEMRQYLEMLPIVGLLVVQWTLYEAGYGHLLRARDDMPLSVLTENPQPASAA